MQDKPLKILMTNFEFPPIGGGGGKTHLKLLEEFSGLANLEIDVLTSKPELGITEEKFAENIHITKVGIHKKNLHRWTKFETILWLYKAGKVYRKMIKQNKYDLCHAFFGFPTGWLSWRNKEKVPYIVSLLGSDVPGPNPRFALDYKIMAPIFKSIWKYSDAIVACSNGLRDRALRFMPSADIDVIPNGINMEKFTPATEYDFSILKLLVVGRLSESKRVDIVIKAMKELQKSISNFELTIVGDGNQKHKLQRLTENLGLTDHVTFLDRVEADHMPDIYRQNHILLSASSSEGMSNVMLEAMASGLPIITTPCEGVDQLVKSNGIITTENPQDIALEIINIWNNKTILNTMSNLGVELSKTFSWPDIARKYHNLYRKITNNQ